MIRYVKELNESIWSLAETRVKELPIYKNSHRQVEANQVGVLGEIVTELWLSHLQIPYLDQKITTHDYLLTKVDKRLEVKTKDRTVEPRPDYDCSVPLYNHEHQIPDYYLFISLLRNKRFEGNNIRRFQQAFILGVSDQNLLHTLGVVWKKGQTDTDNGTTFWTDCINLKIHQLIPLDSVPELWNHKN